jgi:hypothetical protein
MARVRPHGLLARSPRPGELRARARGGEERAPPALRERALWPRRPHRVRGALYPEATPITSPRWARRKTSTRASLDDVRAFFKRFTCPTTPPGDRRRHRQIPGRASSSRPISAPCPEAPIQGEEDAHSPLAQRGDPPRSRPMSSCPSSMIAWPSPAKHPSSDPELDMLSSLLSARQIEPPLQAPRLRSPDRADLSSDARRRAARRRLSTSPCSLKKGEPPLAR